MDGFESHFKAVSRVACNLVWDIRRGRSNGTPQILTWAEGWTAMMFVEREPASRSGFERSR